LQRAEDILDIAIVRDCHADCHAQDVAILIDRQGGMRMLNPDGWSLAALSTEFGAVAVYKVERRGGTVRVEGWDGGQRCLIQRKTAPVRTADLPGMPTMARYDAPPPQPHPQVRFALPA
jgi:hypothetical protein